MDLGVPLESPQGSQASSRVEAGMSGNLLSCKTVKEPFEVQERMCYFPHDAAAEKGLISPGGKNLMVFL